MQEYHLPCTFITAIFAPSEPGDRSYETNSHIGEWLPQVIVKRKSNFHYRYELRRHYPGLYLHLNGASQGFDSTRGHLVVLMWGVCTSKYYQKGRG